jgi:hypothetical protein
VVITDAGDECHVGQDHVGGIQAPTEADLDNGNIDRHAGEGRKGEHGHQLERSRCPPVRVRTLQGRIDLRQLGHQRAECLWCDRLTIDLDPFAQGVEVRGSVQPHPIPRCLQHRREQGSGRALAFRPRDVHAPVPSVGIVQRRAEPCGPCQADPLVSERIGHEPTVIASAIAEEAECRKVVHVRHLSRYTTRDVSGPPGGERGFVPTTSWTTGTWHRADHAASTQVDAAGGTETRSRRR